MSIISLMMFGQISYGGKPLSFTYKTQLKSKTQVLEVPQFDYSALLAEDLQSKDKADRYGKVIKVDVNPENSGVWQKLANGNKIWTLAIRSKSAYSISLIFDNYCLRNGAKLFVYSVDKQSVIGAFTEQNNKANKWFSTIPIQGDEIIIELNTFGNDDYGVLNIVEIVHDYKGVLYALQTGFGQADYCNVNINCKAGKDWQIEKKAVVSMIAGGVLCTGTMLNNTALNKKPYMLTASHCVRTQNAANGGVYIFNYESENCATNKEPIKQSLSGAQLVATGGTVLDFSLLQLDMSPPKEFDVYFAGWNRKPQLSDTGFVSIHHPQGDVKKISKVKGNLEIADYGEGFLYNSHYLVREWKLGTTEQGSSGSAIFDNKHLVIGDLSGGDAVCGNSINDFYTRLDLCWEYFKSPKKQLKYWLDPIKSDAYQLKGIYQNDLTSDFDAAIINSPAFNDIQCVKNDGKNTIFAEFILQNLGTKVLQEVKITGKMNDSILYDTTWTGNLKSREEIDIKFPVDIYKMGDSEITINVELPNYQYDKTSLNNTITKKFSLIKPINNLKIIGNPNICESNSIQKYYTNKAGKYEWKVTGGKILTNAKSKNIEVEWQRWGKRKLALNVSNYCNTDSTHIDINFVKKQLTLTINLVNNENTALWYVVDNKGDTIAKNDKLPKTGKYTENICFSAGVYTLIIEKNGADIKNYSLFSVYEDKVVLSNNDFSENVANEQFKIKKTSGYYINLYPNPARNTITIESYFSDLYQNAQFAIFNQNGKIILPYQDFNERKVVDISHLSVGSYIVKVKGAFGETSNKFVKY